MSRYIIFALLLVFSCSNKKSNDLIDTFFNKFEDQGSNEAIDFLFSSNKLIEPISIEIVDLKKNLSSTVKVLGTYYGHELLSVYEVTDNLIHYTYLVRFEQQPLRFTFTIYRPKDKWQIQNFTFDYHILEELNESSKLNNLKID